MPRSFRNIGYKNSTILLLSLLFYGPVVFAQNNFNGVLINKLDSSVVPYASIRLSETGNSVITDEKGRFVFAVPEGLKQITFTITAIAYKATLAYIRTFSDTEKIYIDMQPGSLNEVTVIGITAVEVANKAVAAIPDNYMDSNYYSFSLYRQYQRVNNVFRNLTESQQIVMFRLSESKHKINARETYFVADLRRTLNMKSPDAIYENDLALHMTENPVYHLAQSSLDPDKFSDYTFSFDTAQSADNYIVNYTNRNFSTESHGVLNYAYFDFKGESWETGKLVIDKVSFAIRKIQRTSFRYPKYDYPKVNNLVQPERKYYVEFIEGQLTADYVLFQGKWYLKQLLHQYTNAFFNSVNNLKDYSITNYFEWYADAITKSLPEDFHEKFYSSIPPGKYHYESSHWKDITRPFYFYNTESIYHDLEENGALRLQYYQENARR